MQSLKLNQTCVYNEKIALTFKGLISKYVWLGRVFYLEAHKPDIWIPANQHGWRWVADDLGFSLTSATLRLYHSDDSKSFLAMHFENSDPVPSPIQLALNLPEHIENYVILDITDEGERTKQIIHPLNQLLEVGQCTVEFTKADTKGIEFAISNCD